MEKIYKLLVNLPLFNGLSREQLFDIVGKTKLHFLKYEKGRMIVHNGEAASELMFLLSGSIECISTSITQKLIIAQRLGASSIIAPDAIFGRKTAFPYTILAVESASLLKISKTDLLRLIAEEPIILFNYLNILASYSQVARQSILAISDFSLKERLALIIEQLTGKTSFGIVLSVNNFSSMHELLGCDIEEYISLMDRLLKNGLINFSEKEIQILDRSALISALKS